MKKEKLLRVTCVFFALMICFTLLSRASYQEGAAVVRTGRPSAMVISHEVRTEGKVVQNQEIAVTTEADLRVASIAVTEGQQVEKGELLFTLDLDWLRQKMLYQQQEMEKQQLFVKDAKSQKEVSWQEKANQQAQASENYSLSVGRAGTVLARAKRDLEAAKRELAEFRENSGQPQGDSSVEQALEAAYEAKAEAYIQAQQELVELQWQIENAVNTALIEAEAEGRAGLELSDTVLTGSADRPGEAYGQKEADCGGLLEDMADSSSGAEAAGGAAGSDMGGGTFGSVSGGTAGSGMSGSTSGNGMAGSNMTGGALIETVSDGGMAGGGFGDGVLEDVSGNDMTGGVSGNGVQGGGADGNDPEEGVPGVSGDGQGGVLQPSVPGESSDSLLLEEPGSGAVPETNETDQAGTGGTQSPFPDDGEENGGDLLLEDEESPQGASQPEPGQPGNPSGGTAGESRPALTQAERDRIEQSVRDSYQARLDEALRRVETAKQEQEAARQALEEYQQERLAALSASGAAAEQALIDKVQAAQDAYVDAAMAANEAAVTSGRAVAGAGIPNASNSSDRMNEITYEQMELALERLERLEQAGGRIYAPADGQITKIQIQTGEKTADTTAMLLADLDKGCSFRAELTQEQEKYIGAGDLITLSGSGKNEKYEDLEVASVQSGEEGQSSQVVVSVPAGTFRIGAAATLEFVKKSGTYNCCVPLSALHLDEKNRPYVLVVDETDSVMGKENRARKVGVTVTEKNESYAALAEGAVSSQDEIIIQSDKTVDEGSRVRVASGT